MEKFEIPETVQGEYNQALRLIEQAGKLLSALISELPAGYAKQKVASAASDLSYVHVGLLPGRKL